MEPIRFVPLNFVAMPKSIITITEPSFVSTLIHTIDRVRSITQTPRTTKFVSLHEDIPREVNIAFASESLDPKGGCLYPPRLPRPLRPPRYFGFPMVNPACHHYH
jgi:hypothetical protein